MFKLLFIGDIFGKPGRRILKAQLPNLKQTHQINFTIANAENCSHGKGLTKKNYQELMDMGIDFLTMGNHTWNKAEIVELLEQKPNIIRPMNLQANFKYANIGVGSRIVALTPQLKLRISNLLGINVNFKNMQTNPFLCLQTFLETAAPADLHFLDHHSETTSEKYTMLRMFDGQINVIVGTHTHVQTNDAHITKKHTAYISDVGMTGPREGIIGAKAEGVIEKMLAPQTHFKLEVAPGTAQINAVVITIDEVQKQVLAIQTINYHE